MPIEKKRESNMLFGLVFQNGFCTGWECCLAGQYILLSCIWLDGQRWMKDYLTRPNKRSC